MDGGHNRAVGHYIENKPLKCLLIGTDEVTDLECLVNIKDIVLYNEHEEEAKDSIRFDPNYRL